MTTLASSVITARVAAQFALRLSTDFMNMPINRKEIHHPQAHAMLTQVLDKVMARAKTGALPLDRRHCLRRLVGMAPGNHIGKAMEAVFWPCQMDTVLAVSVDGLKMADITLHQASLAVADYLGSQCTVHDDREPNILFCLQVTRRMVMLPDPAHTYPGLMASRLFERHLNTNGFGWTDQWERAEEADAHAAPPAATQTP